MIARRKGSAALLLVGLVALAAGIFMAPRVADASKDVEAAVAKAVEGEQRKGAVVAASVQQMGVAAGQLPDSPQKEFIVREGGFVSPLLPSPDPVALLAAERRRVAILEGKAELADQLYAKATKENAALLADNVKLKAKLADAMTERRDMDTQLAESAAYARGKDAIIAGLAALCLLVGGLWLYARLTGFGHVDIARMANRIREGWDPLKAIDATIPDQFHDAISKAADKLRAKEAARRAAAEAVLRSDQ